MGIDAPDEQVQEMLSEASQPVDFDSFAMMMCFKTMEMEPEIVMLEALSKWDEKIQGVISLERWELAPFLSIVNWNIWSFSSYIKNFHPIRLYTQLISYNNDKLTEEEAKSALEEAPMVEKAGLRGLVSPTDRWIDYLSWTEKIAGFRKPISRLYLD